MVSPAPSPSYTPSSAGRCAPDVPRLLRRRKPRDVPAQTASCEQPSQRPKAVPGPSRLGARPSMFSTRLRSAYNRVRPRTDRERWRDRAQAVGSIYDQPLPRSSHRATSDRRADVRAAVWYRPASLGAAVRRALPTPQEVARRQINSVPICQRLNGQSATACLATTVGGAALKLKPPILYAVIAASPTPVSRRAAAKRRGSVRSA
jgi:hypothetical protein